MFLALRDSSLNCLLIPSICPHSRTKNSRSSSEPNYNMRDKAKKQNSVARQCDRVAMAMG